MSMMSVGSLLALTSFALSTARATSAQQAAPADSFPAATLASATTPAECRTAVTKLIRDTHDVIDRQGQARVIPGSVARRLRGQVRPRSQAHAGACARQFDRHTIEPAHLGELVQLYVAAGWVDSALAAASRRIVLAAAPSAAAQAISETVSGLARADSVTVAQRDQLERWVAMLDTLGPGTAPAQAGAHVALRGLYRSDGTSTMPRQHHLERALAAARAMTPVQRIQAPRPYMAVHRAAAGARADSGDISGALAQLDEALRGLPDTAANRSLAALRQHYERVGRPAAPLSAEAWFNAPPGMRQVALSGKVTLVIFGHVWCGYTLQAAPVVQRLYERYGRRGFQAVLLAELAGLGAHQAPASRREELVYQRQVWLDQLGLTYPVGIGNTQVIGAGPYGELRSRAAPFETYGIVEFPTYYLIDPAGVIRHVTVDSPDEMESYFAAMVARYLEPS